MKSRLISSVLIVFFFSMLGVEAKEQSQAGVNDVVSKMQKEFNLTDQQAEAIKPIIQENIAKCQAYLQSIEGESVVNKTNIKMIMKKFRQEENDKLSKVLSEDQMKKLIGKQNLKDALNRDQINFAESLGQGVISTQGAALQF